ncbi:MAG: hypothetical protein KAV83_09420 [Desulfobacterales bacterium]|nr:hypothetical protein [Desulfobacterales bacterium]
MTPEFKKAVAEVAEPEWQSLTKKVKGREVDTGKQWAEVCFLSNGYSIFEQR